MSRIKVSREEISTFKNFLWAWTLDFNFLLVWLEFGLDENKIKKVREFKDNINEFSYEINRKDELSMLNGYSIFPFSQWFKFKEGDRISQPTYKALIPLIKVFDKSIGYKNALEYFDKNTLSIEANFMPVKEKKPKFFKELYGKPKKDFYKKNNLDERLLVIKKLVDYCRDTDKIVFIYTKDDFLGILNDKSVNIGKSIHKKLTLYQVFDDANVFLMNHPLYFSRIPSTKDKSVITLIDEKMEELYWR